ncbi:MAG: large subunit ribosomal protein [Pseudonocardiales bacterium]|jgi:large subunit ribosomal protein L10|nr:rplJ [Jatrophihabitans sp.]MDT4900953.1 large subunit ribosomal protein [Pseudonocardiales bacterium]MDT4906650.1 large subunit ribosomal protein [Pseudonocardiales bacterium]MDT4927674.1 large subunit ribosomal protein [Pseudonocardiales bacterium]
MPTDAHSRLEPNPEKIKAVAEITEHFSSSSAAVITEYRGLTVKQITDLRRALGRDTTYAVVKNTLTRRAAADAGVALDETLLTGPTAIAFVKGDAVVAAKGLRDFAKANPTLVIKGGVLDGKSLSAAEINQIADLESREVLLAKFAGALKALPTRAAGLFQAPLSQMARLAAALEEKKAADAPAAEAPALDSADEPTTPPDAEPEAASSDTTAEAVAEAPETPAEPAE